MAKKNNIQEESLKIHNAAIKALLEDPELLKKKKPFTRGAELSDNIGIDQTCEIAQLITANLPNYNKTVVAQEQFMRELDPFCHDVLFDENIPSLCIKLKDGSYADVKFSRMPVSFQKNIKNKQVLHLTGNKLQFTMMDTEPTDKMRKNFITFKQYWEERNQDGMKRKMVDTQLSYGDAGLLYYFDYKGRIKSRILSFADGYVLCPHNDQNGDRILESVYYKKDDVEYIDSYDDEYMYRWTNDETEQVLAQTTEGGESNVGMKKSTWKWHEPVKHGFDEIPLITKRGDVAWNNAQNIITSYEVLYNIFNAIQRRHGWGILYIKGNFDNQAKKIAGAVVLNDKSLDGRGDAKYLTPPTPNGMLDTLDKLFETIQLNSSTTFLLPKDIKMSGDISGIAIMLTQSLDLENAENNAMEWQNVADKMVRLFKYGVSKELVNTEKNKTAVTDFEEMHIKARFKVWRPKSASEYNQMLATLTGAELLSKETGIELNTESCPDEKIRLERQYKQMEEKAAREMELKNKYRQTSGQREGSKRKNKEVEE